MTTSQVSGRLNELHDKVRNGEISERVALLKAFQVGVDFSKSVIKDFESKSESEGDA